MKKIIEAIKNIFKTKEEIVIEAAPKEIKVGKKKTKKATKKATKKTVKKAK